MQKEDKFSFKDIMIVYILSYMLMPVVARFTSTYLTTYFFMAVSLLISIILVAEGIKTNHSYLNMFVPFLLLQALTIFSPKEDFLVWGYQILLFLMPIFLGRYIISEKSYRMQRIYGIIIIVFVLITSATTILGCMRYPNASRIMATVEDADSAEFIMYNWLNIGDYSFVYTLVLLYPVVILAYKMKKVPLIAALGAAVLCIAVAIFTEYTIALILVILSSFLLLTKRGLTSKGILFFAIFCIIMFFVFSSNISTFLKWLGSSVNSEQMSDRLVALSEGQKGLESAEDNRFELYTMSFNTFLERPLYGIFLTGNWGVGGHSFILDNLAQYGLIGGTIMFFMYRGVYKVFFKPFSDRVGYGYVLWIFIQAIILSLINTGMWLEVICLYAPVFINVIYGKEVSNETTVDRQLTARPAG